MATLIIPSIPNDLIRPIVECIDNDPETLRALSRTCYALQIEAERLLYRFVVAHNVKIHNKFLNNIIRDPSGKRGTYVHVYYSFEKIMDTNTVINHLNHINSPQERLDILEALKALEMSLPMALSKMANLRELGLAVNPFRIERGTKYYGRWVISVTNLFKSMISSCAVELEAFSCKDLDDNLDEEHHHALALFLESQSGLRRLSFSREVLPYNNIITVSQRQWIDDTTLSNLTYLRGRLSTLAIFLRGRNIEMLVWEREPPFKSDGAPIHGHYHLRRKWLEIIKPYTRKVKYLSFSITGMTSDIRNHIIPDHFHNLQCLQLGSFDINNELGYLKALKNLRFVLIPMTEFNAPSSSPNQVVQDIFVACPNIIYAGDYSAPINKTVLECRVWDSRAGPTTQPFIHNIKKLDLQCHHIFELLPY